MEQRIQTLHSQLTANEMKVHEDSLTGSGYEIRVMDLPFWIPQAIKTGGGNDLGTRLSYYSLC